MQKTKISLLTITLLGCVLTTGCQVFEPAHAKDPRKASQAMQDIQDQAQQTPQISNQEMLNSLLPPVSLSANEVPEDRFDVAVKNIDARSFLLGLVDSTNYNMIVNPDVSGKISLKLNNVTISEVLAAVERIYPLMVERKGNMFFVSSAESMTSIYPVDYLNIIRNGKSRTSIAGQTVSGGGDNKNQGGQSNNQQQGGSSSNNVMLLSSSEIETTSKANFWSELKDSLSLIVKGEEQANIIVSPHAGIVIVKALPRTQRLVQEYLGVTQQSLNRQVILEAKIIEVTLNDGFQAGIDWSKFNTINSRPFAFGQQGQVLDQAPDANPLNGVFSMIYQGASFNAAIDLLKSQGDVQVLSSPRVSTVNNQKAIIKVGSDEFFVTDVSTTTVTGNSTSTTPDVTLTPFFSGISLDVTPQINANGEIVLHIHPVVSEVTDQQKTLTLGQDEFTLPLALTNVRESDSIVRTTDKQVIVIGGLMQDKIQSSVNSTPLLGDIPFVGGLFRQTRETVVKSELVILLRANLVDKNYHQNEIQQLKERFNQL